MTGFCCRVTARDWGSSTAIILLTNKYGKLCSSSSFLAFFRSFSPFFLLSFLLSSFHSSELFQSPNIHTLSPLDLSPRYPPISFKVVVFSSKICMHSLPPPSSPHAQPVLTFSLQGRGGGDTLILNAGYTVSQPEEDNPHIHLRENLRSHTSSKGLPHELYSTPHTHTFIVCSCFWLLTFNHFSCTWNTHVFRICKQRLYCIRAFLSSGPFVALRHVCPSVRMKYLGNCCTDLHEIL